jgi:hypothetical protein
LIQGSQHEIAFAQPSFWTTYQNDRELSTHGAAPSKIDHEFWVCAMVEDVNGAVRRAELVENLGDFWLPIFLFGCDRLGRLATIRPTGRFDFAAECSRLRHSGIAEQYKTKFRPKS